MTVLAWFGAFHPRLRAAGRPLGGLGHFDEPAGTAHRFSHLHADGIKAYASAMSRGRKIKTQDDFIAPARRALRRAARKAREENRRLGLPLIMLKNGRISKPT